MHDRMSFSVFSWVSEDAHVPRKYLSYLRWLGFMSFNFVSATDFIGILDLLVLLCLIVLESIVSSSFVYQKPFYRVWLVFWEPKKSSWFWLKIKVKIFSKLFWDENWIVCLLANFFFLGCASNILFSILFFLGPSHKTIKTFK